MGLIRELVDEIIPLPKQSDNFFPEKNKVDSIPRIGYAFLNLIFQCIDCVFIPYLTWLCLIGKIELGWINYIIILVGGIAALFSLFQSVYYFFFPAENYSNPILGRLLGETAIGIMIASILKIKICTFTK
jgi:hypothetical protein